MATFRKRLGRRLRKYGVAKKRNYRRKYVVKGKKSLVGLIKKVISSDLEQKRLTTEFTKNLYHIGGTTNFRDNNIICLTPNDALGSIYQMVQGTSQQTRVGNKINIKRLIFRGIVAPNVYNAVSNPTPNPFMLRMLIVSTKRNVAGQGVADIYNICNNTLFANGSTSLGMLGTLYDIVTPYNTDVITVHFQKTFKIGYENYSGVTGGSDVSQTKASNDYRLNARWSINCAKYVNKVLKFNDNAGGTTSRQVYVVFQPVNFNGSIPVSTTTPCGLIGGVDVFYTDA